MFLRRVNVSLILKKHERAYELGSRESRLNNFINKPSLRGNVGVRKFLFKLKDSRAASRLFISSLANLSAIKEANGSFRAHDGDLSRRPCEVYICAYML